MPATYEAIATTTLGSAANSISFTSIAASWTDLRLVFVSNGQSSTGVGVLIRLNSDATSSYSGTMIGGNGSAAQSFNYSGDTSFYPLLVVNGSTTVPYMITTDIFSYTGSTNKTVLTTSSQDFNGSGDVERQVGLWRNTSAITSLSISLNGGVQTFNTGTTATLYGIKNA